MKRQMMVGVAAAALVASPAAVAARGPTHRRVVRLEHRLGRLERRSRMQKAELVLLRRQVATLTSQATAADQHAAELQGTLTQTAAQLAAANQETADLRVQLGAESNRFAVALRTVRDEVAYMEDVRTGSFSPLPPDLIAKAALDYTAGHIKAYAYGYLEALHPGEPVGGPDLISWYGDVSSILDGEAGQCGHSEYVLARIALAFGLPVREVSFHWTWNGVAEAHAAAEIYYQGGWHFFDAYYGTYWTDAAGNVLSLDAVRAGLGQRVSDQVALVNVVNADQTAFEADPATSVTYEPGPYGY